MTEASTSLLAAPPLTQRLAETPPWSPLRLALAIAATLLALLFGVEWIAGRLPIVFGVVASVQEWPLDAPTLRRFVLYLGLPLGSWLGGAVVERIVDLVLR